MWLVYVCVCDVYVEMWGHSSRQLLFSVCDRRWVIGDGMVGRVEQEAWRQRRGGDTAAVRLGGRADCGLTEQARQHKNPEDSGSQECPEAAAVGTAGRFSAGSKQPGWVRRPVWVTIIPRSTFGRKALSGGTIIKIPVRVLLSLCTTEDTSPNFYSIRSVVWGFWPESGTLNSYFIHLLRLLCF